MTPSREASSPSKLWEDLIQARDEGGMWHIIAQGYEMGDEPISSSIIIKSLIPPQAYLLWT